MPKNTAMDKLVFQCFYCIDQQKQLEVFTAKIKANAEALVQFDERGKFYFLCSSESNLQQRYTDNGWLIVYSYPFNKELTIGVGLHEHTFFAGYYHTLEDDEKVRMWNSIIDFAFRSDFHRIFYPLDNNFNGFLKLDGRLCLYLYDYIPISRQAKASIKQKKVTNLLFRMKEGHAVSLTVKLFSLAMSRIYAITKRLDNSILILIPASTNKKNRQRYFTFCHMLAERCGIRNGFDAIRLSSDSEELKGTKNADKISNLEFNVSLFKNRQVILIDDVLNTGDGFLQLSGKLLELGASSVIGVFLVKTISEAELTTSI